MDYTKYGTDKETEHSYFTEVYDHLFGPWRHQDAPFSLLEIGLWNGGCLELWRDYFRNPKGSYTGIDYNPIDPRIAGLSQVHFYQGNQIDEPFMEGVIAERGPFDVVIDDGSHNGTDSMASMILLWKALKPGGIYVVEDFFYAWPKFVSRPIDGDGLLLKVGMEVLQHLPIWNVRDFHVDYRVNSGLLWLRKASFGGASE